MHNIQFVRNKLKLILMTLINTNKISSLKSKKTYLNEKLIIFLFSFLPISFILGNTAINSNILVIDVFFLLTCYNQKKWSWIKNKYLYFFIIIWIYLIFNSIISTNIINTITITNTFDTIRNEIIFPRKESIIRSIGFIRFIIFLFAFEYFFIHSKKLFNKIYLYWFIIILVILFDIIFERIFGHNLLNFKSPSPHRIVSFFKDELVVGGLLFGFSFLIIGFLFNTTNNRLERKILSNFFFILTIVCIYLTGERSNFIKALIIGSTIIFILSNSNLYLKKKYIFLLIIAGILLPTLISKDIYDRQIGFFKRIQRYDHGSLYEKFGHLKHFAHYETAWQIFKDYPIFGIGNSKFRYICHDKKYYNAKIKLSDVRCSNHPHQVHLEILSEQGILGYLIIFFTIFHILFNSFKAYRKTNNMNHLSSILFVVVFFIPLLPSGSFFSTFNASIFWINLSIVHAFLSKSKE